MPGGRRAISKWPLSFETVERLAPVAAFVAVTVTPGRIEPVSSVTAPEIEPLLLCAKTENDVNARSSARSKRKRCTCIGDSLCVFKIGLQDAWMKYDQNSTEDLS